MTKYYCIDRIEGEYAVIECPNRKMIDVSISELPENIKEGDCLKKVEGRSIIDNEERERRIKKMKDLLNRIKSK